ncbi:MAG: polysaccharide deacetylase, partial [Pseudomonadota bacterium]
MSPTADATRPPEFVLSLDFELLWGVRDHADRVTYGRNILGAREAIPRMLELFARHRIAATWATVGFLFCRDRDELIAALPPEELRPRYANPLLSSYGYLDELGRNEREDPYVFGASLLDRIQETPLQEIGTHTLSHFYCLEDGQSEAMFEADLTAAAMLAGRRGLLLRSIVFPRNQYAAGHLAVCRRHGICAYRGNPAHWAYAPTAGETLRRRALRFIDQHTGVLGPWM